MLAWWAKLSLAGKLLGFVGLLTGAITGTAASWPLVEPWYYATRGYVRVHFDQNLSVGTKDLRLAQAEQTQAIYGLQIDNAERDCERVADEIISLSVMLPKEPDDIARQRKAFQIEQKKQRYNDLDRKLKGWRNGRGCPYSTGQ